MMYSTYKMLVNISQITGNSIQDVGTFTEILCVVCVVCVCSFSSVKLAEFCVSYSCSS